MQTQVEAGLAGDWETFFSVYAEDAVLMLPNLPGAEGLTAIREIDWVSAIEWEQSISEIEGLGDAALVRAMRGLGHDVLMVPMYLPLQAHKDQPVANAPIFFYVFVCVQKVSLRAKSITFFL